MVYKQIVAALIGSENGAIWVHFIAVIIGPDVSANRPVAERERGVEWGGGGVGEAGQVRLSIN